MPTKTISQLPNGPTNLAGTELVELQVGTSVGASQQTTTEQIAALNNSAIAAAQSNAETFATNASNTAQYNAETYALGLINGLPSPIVTTVVAGANISVNSTNVHQPIVSAPNALTSIQAGTNVTVDNTNPNSPKINATGGGGNPVNVNNQTGTSYTLQLSDAPAASSYRGWVGMSNANANSVQIPANASVAFPVGTQIEVADAASGQTTIIASTGVSLEGPTITGSGQGSSGKITKIGADLWWVSGGIPFVSSGGTTLNPSDKSTNIALSNANLTATETGSSVWALARATVSHTSGKYYYEMHIDSTGVGYIIAGVANSSASLNSYVGVDVNGWGYYATNGAVAHNGQSGGYATLTTGDILGVAVDLTAGNIWYAKNGTWQNSGNPATGANPLQTGVSGTLFPAVSLNANGDAVTCRFSSGAFTYAAPSGFSPW